MQICIIGLPGSGKTAVFFFFSGGKAEIASRSASSLAPFIGVAKVPEPRLKILESIFKPSKIVMAEIKFVDFAGITKSSHKGEGIYGPFLNYLSNADALIQVVRVFDDAKVPHIYEKIDPKRDMANMEVELIFSDLTIIDRRLERIELNIKGAKSTERDQLIHEKTLLQKIKDSLEKEIPVWKQEISSEDLKSLSGYQFLTAKPMLVILNIGEDQLNKAQSLENDLKSVYSFGSFDILSLCAKLEMELSQLSSDEAIEFRTSMGLTEAAKERVIAASFNLLGLVTFFTTASSELKAWTIARGVPALKAAGKIHTDMEKGFIRAEVINVKDLEKLGTVAEAKKHGQLRLEGKNYIIKDGDVVTFMFNI